MKEFKGKNSNGNMDFKNQKLSNLILSLVAAKLFATIIWHPASSASKRIFL